MTLEFDTSYKKVPEKLVTKIRNEMLKLSHTNKNISKAEILLKEDESMEWAENKVCEIRLIVSGDNLFIHSRTDGFEKSAKKAIKDLKGMLQQEVKEQKELPDEVTSTVKV